MTLVETNCIFCGKESFKVDWEENGFTGKRCGCGLLYVSPRPQWNDILEGYNSTEADSHGRSRIESETLGRLNARHRLGILERYISGGDLLEIGPGSGYFLDESRRAGFRPFGVELNLLQARFIREHHQIPVETGPLNNHSFQGRKFDVICHFDVVSHFYDPIPEFRRFYDRLGNGGFLFFETGNGGDLSQGWLRFIGRLQYPQHLFLFTRKNIERLCEETGFEIIKVFPYSILLQLLVLKAIRRFQKGLFEKPREGRNRKAEVPTFTTATREHALQGAIRMNLFVRYGIGRIFPKIGPQTLLYVAKKRAL